MKNLLFLLFTIGLFLNTNAQVIDLVGAGLIDSANVSNVKFSDYNTIEAIIIGSVYKAPENYVLSGEVTFDGTSTFHPGLPLPAISDIIDKNPTSANPSIGYWVENFTSADADGIELEITNTLDKPYVLATYAYIYRDLPYVPTYTSYESLETVFFNQNGLEGTEEDEGAYIYNVSIDEGDLPRDIIVRIPISELDNSEQMAVINISAGDVTLDTTVNTYNEGNSFYLGAFTLEDVPGYITNVSVSIYSPDSEDGNGDSFFVNGILVDVDNECSQCKGQMTFLSLQYLGNEEDATIEVYQKQEEEKVLIYSGVHSSGDVFSFYGIAKHLRLGSKIWVDLITATDTTRTKITTCCSEPIYAGLITQNGLYKILAGTSFQGGALCDEYIPKEDGCGECHGGLLSLTLKYLGESGVDIKVYADPDEGDDFLMESFQNVPKGASATFEGTGSEGKLPRAIYFIIEKEGEDDVRIDINTNCAINLYVGTVFDGLAEVIAGTSKGGGPLCTLEEAECSECKGFLTFVTLKYLGVSGVDITIWASPEDGEDYVMESFQNVPNGAETTLVGDGHGGKFAKDIYAVVEEEGKDDVIVNISTSCHEGIYVGTVFGGLAEVMDGRSKGGGPLCEFDELPCGECKGGLTSLTLKYLGPSGIDVTVYANPEEGDDYEMASFPNIQHGTVATFEGDGHDGKLEKDIYFLAEITGQPDVRVDINTSCQEEIYVGTIFDDVAEVMAGTSKGGGLLCEAPKVDPQPTAHLPMDENEGTTAEDITLNTNDGTLINGTTWTNGISGSSLWFDGIDDRVECTTSEELNLGSNDFTISTWVNLGSQLSLFPTLVAKGAGNTTDAGYWLLVKNSKLRLYISDGNSRIRAESNTLSIIDNTWYHLAVTIDRDGDISFYVDGVLKGTVDVSSFGGVDISNTRDLTIGSWKNYSYTLVEGKIDDFKLFNVALDASQINNLFGEYAAFKESPVNEAYTEINDLIIYPNPFTRSATLEFSLEKDQHVNISIYDLHGNQVAILKDEIMLMGRQSIRWNGNDRYSQELPAGMYIVKLIGTKNFERKRIVKIR